MLAIAAFVLFTKHISRWESIYLTLPADALLSTFCATALVAPAASILRSVHISLGNWFGNGEVVRSLLAHSPALKELHWSSRRIPGAFDTNCANGIDSLIHNGSWQHITRLALNTLLTLSGVLSILKQAIRLEYLKLGCFSRCPVDGFNPALIRLGVRETPLAAPGLNTLIVHQQALDIDLPALLEYIACPGLAHLTIACESLPVESSMETLQATGAALANFISRTKLETLVLKNTGISAAHLFSCLVAAPQLQRLSVHASVGGHCSVDDALLSALTVCRPAVEQRQLLCPQLRELFLHYGVLCSDGACADMVQSRVAVLGAGSDGKRVERLRVVNVIFTEQQHTTNSLDINYFSEILGSDKYRPLEL